MVWSARGVKSGYVLTDLAINILHLCSVNQNQSEHGCFCIHLWTSEKDTVRVNTTDDCHHGHTTLRCGSFGTAFILCIDSLMLGRVGTSRRTDILTQ